MGVDQIADKGVGVNQRLADVLWLVIGEQHEDEEEYFLASDLEHRGLSKPQGESALELGTPETILGALTLSYPGEIASEQPASQGLGNSPRTL